MWFWVRVQLDYGYGYGYGYEPMGMGTGTSSWVRVRVRVRNHGYGYGYGSDMSASHGYGYGYGFETMDTGTGMGTQFRTRVRVRVWVRVRVLQVCYVVISHRSHVICTNFLTNYFYCENLWECKAAYVKSILTKNAHRPVCRHYDVIFIWFNNIFEHIYFLKLITRFSFHQRPIHFAPFKMLNLKYRNNWCPG